MRMTLKSRAKFSCIRKINCFLQAWRTFIHYRALFAKKFEANGGNNRTQWKIIVLDGFHIALVQIYLHHLLNFTFLPLISPGSFRTTSLHLYLGII